MWGRITLELLVSVLDILTFAEQRARKVRRTRTSQPIGHPAVLWTSLVPHNDSQRTNQEGNKLQGERNIRVHCLNVEVKILVLITIVYLFEEAQFFGS